MCSEKSILSRFEHESRTLANEVSETVSHLFNIGEGGPTSYPNYSTKPDGCLHCSQDLYLEIWIFEITAKIRI